MLCALIGINDVRYDYDDGNKCDEVMKIAPAENCIQMVKLEWVGAFKQFMGCKQVDVVYAQNILK